MSLLRPAVIMAHLNSKKGTVYPGICSSQCEKAGLHRLSQLYNGPIIDVTTACQKIHTRTPSFDVANLHYDSHFT